MANMVRSGTVAGIAILLAVVAFWVMADGLRVAAAPPAQGSDPIVVSNKWCEFDLDYDDDGESNGSFNPDDGSYLPQETPILGRCNFTFATSIRSTILFDSELDDWRAEVTLTEEPSGAVRATGIVHPGNRRVEDVDGGMVARVDLKGRTPRGEMPRDLSQGYQHQLQVPENFRLLEITIITSADDRERVASHEVAAASNAYIEAHEAIADIRGGGNAPSAEVMALADQLLAEGYPGIAERVAALPAAPPPAPPVVEEPPDDGLNIWMVITIVLIAAIVIVPVAIWLLGRRHQPQGGPTDR